tara:strand:- start:186 stop:335 length:150 start_codon:yes stop_codon:yes gene_type:complete
MVAGKIDKGENMSKKRNTIKEIYNDEEYLGNLTSEQMSEKTYNEYKESK